MVLLSTLFCLVFGPGIALAIHIMAPQGYEDETGFHSGLQPVAARRAGAGARASRTERLP